LFALVFGPSLLVLFVSKLLLGYSVGLSTVTPPLYVTETAPEALRSSTSSLTNVVIVLGYFVASLTGYGASQITEVWSSKLAFVMTFLVPGLYLIGLLFLPESPVWYIKKVREDDAKKSIRRLYGQNADVDRII
jgi:MFS transporter, SP family, general alpha glucoside:H+ symporter